MGNLEKVLRLKHWSNTDDPNADMPISAAIFDKLDSALDTYGDDGPYILTISGFDDDFNESYIEIQLPGGIVMVVDFMRRVGRSASSHELITYSDSISKIVTTRVERCASVGFQNITWQFNEARVAINKLFAQWSLNNDAHVHLIDIRLKAHTCMEYTGDTPVEIIVNCLNEDLLPEEVKFETESPETVIETLMILYEDVPEKTQTKAKFGLEGADGTISLIALRSLLQDPNQTTPSQGYLPKLINIQEKVIYPIKCGHASLDTDSASVPHIRWLCDLLIISDTSLPSTISSSATGRPITDIISHPYLTSDILIEELTEFNEPDKRIEIVIQQPRFFYNRGTGRFWAAEIDE